MVKYVQKSPLLGLNRLLAIFKVPKTSFFGPKTAFFSCLGLQNPLKVPQEGPSWWRKVIQVIIYLEFQREGFWVKKNALWSTLKLPFLAKIQVLKPFQPSRPLFLTETPPNWPQITLAHVLGPHWYLLGGPRSKNVRFIAILVNPIWQSGPEIGQNSQNHNFKFKSDIFWFQWANYYQKTVMPGLFWSWRVKIALFGLKNGIFAL